jgi:hypothetical protein
MQDATSRPRHLSTGRERRPSGDGKIARVGFYADRGAALKAVGLKE